MKIWYDARTGKQVRYAVAIAQRFRKLGHEVILTTRKHRDTLEVAKLLNENFTVVGKYGLGALSKKLMESSRRQLKFCRMFEKNRPDIAISHGSVELCRVAFGLGIPSVCTNDTPHAEAVKRLTTPLADYLVVRRLFQSRCLKVLELSESYNSMAWTKWLG